MGDSTSTVSPSLPTPAAIARAELFTREQFVYEGESLEEALAPGSARRRAFDAALGEIESGNKQPSIGWRRHFSLLLGLERLLSQDEPHLVDGTVLSAHQFDDLSGTLTALLAEAQRNGNGNGAAAGNNASAPAATVADTASSAGNGSGRSASSSSTAAADSDSDSDSDSEEDLDEEEFDLEGEGETEDEDEDVEVDEDEEPQDWQDADAELDEDVSLEQA